MMSMNRTRVRHDRFTLRGWVWPFHELRDQGVMASLVPESDEPRLVYLWGRRDEPVEIRKGDVAIIYPQIGWPLPGNLAPAVPPSLERAAEAVKKFQEAAATPPPPVSTVEDVEPEIVTEQEPEAEPDMSQRLLVYRRQDESVRDFVSRLTPELEREFNKLTQLQLYGAGEARLADCAEDPEASWSNNPMTVSERHGEISGLLAELQRLGAEAEAKG
jgi:hypothetical protein